MKLSWVLLSGALVLVVAQAEPNLRGTVYRALMDGKRRRVFVMTLGDDCSNLTG